jgi:hypothetical protein
MTSAPNLGTKSCPRCGGWVYTDPPYTAKSDRWCINCCEPIYPKHFKPLPYAVRFDESSPQIDWEIDEYGNIVDEIDKKVEKLVEGGSFLTVSHVAKKLHCSNGDARISLERLVRIGSAEKFQYGPQNRWVGYRKKGFG